jgi:ligand-binding SRPBCC domain-containing protein
VVPAPRDAVWARITTPEGINHELRPLLTMTVPEGLQGETVATVALGAKLGRSWIKLFGVVPVDYDDLCLVELEPGARFLERSRTFEFEMWQHERALTDEGSGTRITDRLTFGMRPGLRWMPGSEAAAARVVGRIFTHRHNRLQEFFSEAD